MMNLPQIAVGSQFTSAEAAILAQIADLPDPNANALLGWDDTDGAYKHFLLGSGLSYDHGTHTLSASGSGVSFGTDNQVPYTNAAGDDFDYSAGMTFDGTTFTTTALQVDNINVNGNTISSTAGTDLLITPLAGQQLILDGTIEIDAGVVLGITSLGVTGTRVTAGFFTDLTVTNAISGSITGTAAVATTVTAADEATDTSCFITFVTAATGNLGVKTNANMTFNSNTGVATFASTVLTTTDINGGTIDGTIIGGSSAAAATITTLIITSFGGNWTNAGRTVADMGTLTTVDINGGTVDGAVIGGASAAAITGTTITANTGFMPDANDGAYLGQAGTAFADLFLAEGGVINWDSGDATLTQTGNVLAVAGADLRVATADVGTNADSVPTLSSTSTFTNKTLTAPTINASTLGGIHQLAEGGVLQLDAASSADGAYCGITRAGTAGATLAFGDCVYLQASDSRWELADADAASTSGDVMVGFCVLAAASDGDPTVILFYGIIRADAAFPALTIGAPAYIGTTAGDIQTAQPSGTDDVIRRVGFAWTADELFVNVSNDYVTHT